MVPDNEQVAPKEASFAGRLRMQDYMFNKSQVATPTPGLQPNSNDETIATPLRKSSRLMSGSGRASLSPSKSSSSTTDRKSPSRKSVSGTSTSAINRKQPLPRTTSSPARSRASPTPSSSSFSPSKTRARVPSSYAPPSKYSHLNHLPDALAPNLLILFIGLNPGISTAQQGHAYAHPSNLFWKLLYSSGITPVPCTADEDRTMPERFSLGLTNIVSRPSRNGAELSKAEMDEGVAVLEAKCAKWRPEAVCIVGKSIWESVFRVRKARALKKGEFSYGWQDGERRMGLGGGGGGGAANSTLSSWFTTPTPASTSSSSPHFSNSPTKTEDVETQQDSGQEGASKEDLEQNIDLREEGENDEERVEQDQQPYAGARIFVASSTSGLAATLKPAEKEAIWKELGDWCVERRRQRGGR